MTIYDKLLKDIPSLDVDEIIVGVFSVLVKTGKNIGIASTIKYGNVHDRIDEVKVLERKNLRELAELVCSDNMLAASLGMAAIRELYKDLMFFENFPREGDWRERDISEQLPRAEVVALTATTLTNHTFHEVIRHMSPESYKIILGPTTPLSPVLFDYGFHAVCGTLIRDYDLVKKQVLMATPTRYLEGVEYVGILNAEC